MLGIITYDCPHKKTSDIIERCHEKINFIYTIPFKERKKREVKINHRPYQFTGPTPQEMGKSYSIEVIPFDILDSKDNPNLSEIIVGGAGILPENIVNNYKVINAHPGLIPTTRGLDSFKWSILFQETMGVTIHQINSEIDLGIIIHHSKTIIYEQDNIMDLAKRHYLNEIDCLSQYINSSLKRKILPNLKLKESRRRMSSETEDLIIDKFDTYKNLLLSK